MRVSVIPIGVMLMLTVALYPNQIRTMGTPEPVKLMLAMDVNDVENPIAERQTFREWRSKEERDRFIKVIQAFEGTPYMTGGNTSSGMDCSGLVCNVYRIFDTPVPRTVKRLFEIGRPVARGELEEGDLVFFNGENKPVHVAVYIGNGKIIHASSNARQIRTDPIDSPWHYKHYIGAVRVRELSSGRETR